MGFKGDTKTMSIEKRLTETYDFLDERYPRIGRSKWHVWKVGWLNRYQIKALQKQLRGIPYWYNRQTGELGIIRIEYLIKEE